MPFLHPSRNPDLWLPAVQPRGPVVVDQGHRLSRGMIGYWLATPVSGMRNLLNTGSDLLPLGGGGIDVGPGGTEATSNIGVGWYAPVAAAQKPTSAVTMFWQGVVDTSTSIGGSPPIFGCVHNDADSSPFASWVIRRAAAADAQLAWNHTSGFASYNATGMLTVGERLSITGTILMGGAVQIYKNGVVFGAGSTAVNNVIAYGATAQIRLGPHILQSSHSGCSTEVAVAWNRVLTPDEIAAMAMQPYSMILPVG